MKEKLLREQIRKILSEKSSTLSQQEQGGDNSPRFASPGTVISPEVHSLPGWEESMSAPSADDPIAGFKDNQLHIATGTSAEYQNHIQRGPDGELYIDTPNSLASPGELQRLSEARLRDVVRKELIKEIGDSYV